LTNWEVRSRTRMARNMAGRERQLQLRCARPTQSTKCLGRSEVDMLGGPSRPVMPIVNRPVPELKAGWLSASAPTSFLRASFAMVVVVGDRTRNSCSRGGSDKTTTLREAGDHVVREHKSPTKGARDYHVRDCASGLLARFEGASEHSRALQRTAAVTSPAPAGNSPAASSDYFERRRTL
jgi:hypothetical protein